MRRSTTVVFICGLLIVADLIVFRQTLAASGGLTWFALSAAMFSEIVSAMLLVWLGIVIFRKSHRRQKKPFKARGRLAVAGP
jgi:hypothetical protein